jgi:hypothetical protein
MRVPGASSATGSAISEKSPRAASIRSFWRSAARARIPTSAV